MTLSMALHFRAQTTAGIASAACYATLLLAQLLLPHTECPDTLLSENQSDTLLGQPGELSGHLCTKKLTC